MRTISLLAFACAAAAGLSHADAPLPSPMPTLKVLTTQRVAWAVPENDAGELAGDTPLTHLTVVLKRAPDRQQAFEQFLRDQQDPASSNFHRWLTPLEVGERFGLPEGDIEAVTSWLGAQGLHVDGVSNSRTRIVFSGSAARVGAAFASTMHSYVAGAQKRIALAGAPRLPADIAPLVLAVHGLESVSERPSLGPAVPRTGHAGPEPKFTSCTGSDCVHSIWPGDFAVLYGVNHVYQQGLSGAGQTIAIIGRANVYLPDIENFQSQASIRIQDPVTIVPPNGIAPGPALSTPPSDPATLDDQREATLDVTRASGVAPGATIDLVVSLDAPTASGLSIASSYVVDSNPVIAQVMNVSFNLCEQSAGQSSTLFWDNLYSQAAAEGISVFVSSGDGGAAGCDIPFQAPPATQTASPNSLCASSYATCVGGTQFNENAEAGSGGYWNTTNGTGFASALRYIPEGAWNEPADSTGKFQVASGGGGVSTFVPTPYWQKAPGVPGTQGRYTPDVSFSAASHDGYASCLSAMNLDCVSNSSGRFTYLVASGTSASAPSMAGVAAILNQNMGSPQGNLNPSLYSLASSSPAGVFNDITVSSSGVSNCRPTLPSLCNNSTPAPNDLQGGLAGYTVGAGYDLATGLGSINVDGLFTKWTSVVATAPLTANFQGLWWASPAGSESGWGINFAHEGDTIVATWYTYNTGGTGMWLVMTAPKSGTNTYSGTLYTTTGPPFSSVPFNSSSVTATAQGTGTLTFFDANNGSFSYAIGGVSQSKAITREVFGTMPTCGPTTGDPAAATNYTDLWWASPPGSESGWGINLTHESSTIFATWFTYDASGSPMWLVVSAPQSAPNTYSGTLYRTTGPPFNSQPFNPQGVNATQAGSASFTFANGNSAQFAYTVGSVSQTKTITREVFVGNGTTCQ
ncbi:MAG TPA: S53 family peptidase [Usitatibacter sp.]|nr:S53 family peptidase [Usitatibacter sp.]